MSRRRKPWLLRFAWALVRFVAVILFIAWAVASVAINHYGKETAEQRLSAALGQKVTIGHLRAGWNMVRPTVAAVDVRLGPDEKSPVAEASSVEGGIYLKSLINRVPLEEAKFHAAISGLKAGGKPYGDYEAEVTRPRGMHVMLSDIKGEYKGASLTGEASEDDKYRFKADLAAKDLDYSTFAEGVKGGKARLTLHLTGMDQTQREVTTRLAGRATLVGGEGKVEGRALNLWAGSLLTAFLPGQDKDTHLNCAVADFDIVNGVAHSKTILIDTDKATITGKGTVDLVRQRVDLRFVPETKGMAVLSLATPLVVSGPFNDITTHPDATGVAEKVGGVLLGTIAAPAALLPFLHAHADANPCQKYLEQKSK